MSKLKSCELKPTWKSSPQSNNFDYLQLKFLLIIHYQIHDEMYQAIKPYQWICEKNWRIEQCGWTETRKDRKARQTDLWARRTKIRCSNLICISYWDNKFSSCCPSLSKTRLVSIKWIWLHRDKIGRTLQYTTINLPPLWSITLSSSLDFRKCALSPFRNDFTFLGH